MLPRIEASALASLAVRNDLEEEMSATKVRSYRTAHRLAIRLRRLTGSQTGMATAEYAIATLAAVGFAALLVAVLSSGEVRGMLMSLISSALSFG
ncbi:DUF4244 domain-containing protein [Arthrobacter sp. CAN_A1]|uniref:DUF4244 domain-containing protein n=1 Tax=Arthrobacter sp. CAN_A1 TaxID=2787717 RepID=UPI001A1CA80E